MLQLVCSSLHHTADILANLSLYLLAENLCKGFSGSAILTHFE